jgi:hypothetical protein
MREKFCQIFINRGLVFRIYKNSKNLTEQDSHFSNKEEQIASKHMRIHLTSLTIRGNANQNYFEIPCHLVRMAVIKKKTANAGEDTMEKGTPIHTYFKCKLVQPL